MYLKHYNSWVEKGQEGNKRRDLNAERQLLGLGILFYFNGN